MKITLLTLVLLAVGAQAQTTYDFSGLMLKLQLTQSSIT